MKGGVPSIMEIKSNKLAGGAGTRGLETRRGIRPDNDSCWTDHWSESDVFLSSWTRLLITVVIWSEYILRILVQDLWNRHCLSTWSGDPKAASMGAMWSYVTTCQPGHLSLTCSASCVATSGWMRWPLESNIFILDWHWRVERSIIFLRESF